MAQSNKGRMEPDSKLNAGTLAKLLGISAKDVKQLTADGILEAVKGRYILGDAMQSFIDEMSHPQATQEARDSDRRIRKARADIHEIEAGKLQDAICKAEIVAMYSEFTIHTVCETLSEIPGKLAYAAKINAATETAEQIRQIVYVAMEKLANMEFDESWFEDRIAECTNEDDQSQR